MINFPCPGQPQPVQHLHLWLGYPGLVLSILALLLWWTTGYQAGFLWLNQLGALLPAAFWTHITLLGDARVAVALALPFALVSPALAWRVILALIIGGLGVHLMKAGFAMPRPPALLEAEHFNLLGPALMKGSFPSGHTLTAFATAGLAASWLPNASWRILALAVAALAGISRTMVGVHWPVDVLAGAGLGLLSAWATLLLARHLPWGEHCKAHSAWIILLAATTLSLFGYDGHFPQNRHAGSTLAIVVLLLSAWSWISCREQAHALRHD